VRAALHSCHCQSPDLQALQGLFCCALKQHWAVGTAVLVSAALFTQSRAVLHIPGVTTCSAHTLAQIPSWWATTGIMAGLPISGASKSWAQLSSNLGTYREVCPFGRLVGGVVDEVVEQDHILAGTPERGGTCQGVPAACGQESGAANGAQSGAAYTCS
jgi:hypothetical protein